VKHFCCACGAKRLRAARGLSIAALIAIALAAGVGLFPHQAPAGPVQFQSGGITVTYLDPFNGTDSKSFDVTFPGAATERYQGVALDDETLLGDRGDSGVTYDLRDQSTGASFDVNLFHQNKGDQQRTVGGTVSFDFSFTTDRELQYSFTADPTGPARNFSAQFANVTQDLQIDAFGTLQGSLLDDGHPVAKTLQGVLPAGTHSLNILLDVSNGRSTIGGLGSGTVSISLEQGGPVAIPLPPAVWTGLMVLAGTGLIMGTRKRSAAMR
jgi:hypothetical protein